MVKKVLFVVNEKVHILLFYRSPKIRRQRKDFCNLYNFRTILCSLINSVIMLSNSVLGFTAGWGTYEYPTF